MRYLYYVQYTPTYFKAHYVYEHGITFLNQLKLLESILGFLVFLIFFGGCVW